MTNQSTTTNNTHNLNTTEEAKMKTTITCEQCGIEMTYHTAKRDTLWPQITYIEGRRGMKPLAFEVKRLRPSVTQGEASVYCNGVKLVQFGDKIEMDGKHGDIIGHWGSTISDEEFITATLFPNEIRRNYYPQEVNAIFDKIKSIIAE